MEITAEREALDPLLIQAAEALLAAFEPPSAVGRWDRHRFCVIASGLNETTFEVMLDRAAAQFHDVLRYSILPFDSGTSPEEVLTAGLRPRAKTAILAD